MTIISEENKLLKARLISIYTFNDLAMIYISYDGETFILRIVILKRNLTIRACYSAYSILISLQILYKQYSFSVYTIAFPPTTFWQ